MSRRLVSSLNGVGSLYAGDLLLRTTPYQLSVWADDQQTGDLGVEAATAIDGHIDITGIGEAVVLAGPDTLTLELEDHRRLSIRLTSSLGGVEGRRWLPAGSTTGES
jgi:hypothetical protein